jgi:16S rRNA C967 or C1407 C5-methylase (RsmB/RsmF family)
MPGGHRSMQESERKWKRVSKVLKAMCSPPEKKIKINTLRNSVTDMQRRSKQGF